MIALDAVSHNNTLTSSLTVSHTCAANTVLFICVSIHGTSVSPTSVTYGGRAATPVRVDTYGLMTHSIYYIVNPSAGALNWIVQSPVANFAAAAYSFTGVDMDNVIDVQTVGTAASTTVSTVVTTTKNNSWIFDIVSVYYPWNNFTVGGNQTEQFIDNYYYSPNISNIFFAGSTVGPVSPAGATTISWSDDAYGGGGALLNTIIAIKAATPPTIQGVSTAQGLSALQF